MAADSTFTKRSNTMKYIDIFNGDADGICALIQLRNASPIKAQLITGIKRDIQLLKQITSKADSDTHITVLDISMEKNTDALQDCLQQGAQVDYFDHHRAGDIPENKNLNAHINTSAETCTSLIVNQFLKNQFSEWAVTGAFGDNLEVSATTLAKQISLSESQFKRLKKLGIYLNYNGYGASVSDLHFPPDKLFTELVNYPSPLQFLDSNNSTYNTLEAGYQQDLGNTQQLSTTYSSNEVEVYTLPNEPWARRVSGVFGNQLANKNPNKAHAVLTELGDESYLVSVRAPLNNKTGADEICGHFPTGGGRKGAAGINKLPGDSLDAFIDRINQQYKQ